MDVARLASAVRIGCGEGQIQQRRPGVVEVDTIGPDRWDRSPGLASTLGWIEGWIKENILTVVCHSSLELEELAEGT